nr:MAG TPA: hypothetical protein [Caudoviricetes sp.]
MPILHKLFFSFVLLPFLFSVYIIAYPGAKCVNKL